MENVEKAKTAKIKKITKLNKKEDVYNLEVKEYHNFSIENGLIVHNCIDAIRYALEQDMLNNLSTKTKIYRPLKLK